MSHKWDQRFLSLARLVSTWSKDPSTKCGAVIVRPDRVVVSMGYNGFPKGCLDLPWLYEIRERKYRRVVHAERNALLFATQPVVGCTLYTYPFVTCAPCAAMVIQAGIKRVVHPPASADVLSRWSADIHEAGCMYWEAGVETLELELTE